MTKGFIFFSLIFWGSVAFTGEDKTTEALAIGSSAPKTDLKMMDISGKEISLKDIKKENGLLIIFSCNTCPFVNAWENRYPGLAEICEKNNIGMVLVNSNEAKRNGEDSMEEMKKHARLNDYKCYYTLDENSVLADTFGAKTTPHVFLFNNEFKLVYRGSIDDTEGKKEKQPKDHYLLNAIMDMISQKTIVPNDTKAIGCSIKRVKTLPNPSH